jgi:hypothetical protein
MPKVKFQPGKVIVCCGDNDCVEIDTSDDHQSPGSGGAAPPYEPPLSGGVAVYVAPRMMIERLVLNRNTAANEFWSDVEKIEKRSRSDRANEDLEFTIQLVLPYGSKLRLTTLQALAKRLGANVEVHFASQE